jgi:DNA-binding NarL/FixJ family response regulator
MAERVGDRRALIEALRARQFVCGGPDGAEERLALGDRLVALGLDGDDDALMWGHLWRFDACAQIGDLNAVAGEVTLIDALAERMRSPLARWHAIRSRATLDAAQGRFAQALAGGERSLAEARRSGNDGSILPSIGFLLAVRGAVGDFAQSPEAVRLISLDRAASAGLQGMLAMWRLAAGQHDEARALFRELPPIELVPPFVLLPAASGMTELAATFGDRDLVEHLHAVLLPHAHRMVCGGAGVIIIEGPVRTPLGIGAEALDRLDEAEEHLRAAVDVADRAGLLPAGARARYHLARVLARRGRDAEAAALAATTAARAGELRMRPLREAATRLGRGAGPLTRREREVAALVARGLTSKAIAADLYLSERTVETHVQHILTKLGLANRTQIATWMTGLRTQDT